MSTENVIEIDTAIALVSFMVSFAESLFLWLERRHSQNAGYLFSFA